MTEKKKIPEQMALYTYQSPVGSVRASRAGSGGEDSWQGGQQSSPVSRRVVTVPDADLSRAGQTFAQRQESQRQQKVSRAYARPLPYTKTVLVPRTLAQTGTRASSGRMPAVRPRLPYRKKAIPLRKHRQPARKGLLWRILSIFTLGVVSLLVQSVLFNSSAFSAQLQAVLRWYNVC